MIVFSSRENQIGVLQFSEAEKEIMNKYWLKSSVQQNASLRLQSSEKVPKSSDFVLSFLIFIPFPGGKHIPYTLQVKAQRGKSTLYSILSKLKNADSGGN